jgi:iron(II)-dependent oxidoreductase
MIRTDAGLSRAQVVDLLTEARARTLLLVAPLSEDDLRRQHDPLMSPIVWDLGHIAHFEEVWLLENLERGGDGSEGLRGLYDPFTNPRAVRGSMALPGLAETLARMADVRRRVLDRLETLELDTDAPLLADGYVFRMVLQHEYQHNETILQTLQLKQGAPYRAPRAIRLPDAARRDPAMVRFPGGPVVIGTDDRSAAYDNERDGHTVVLSPFWIDVDPVTCGEYLAFMEAGGYARREWWSPAGWRWLEESGVRHPGYWRREDGAWLVRSMDRIAPVDPRRPVCHVCYYEAEAFARWAGKRLPSEAEWEAAAAWDPASGEKRGYPWGTGINLALANVDQLAFDPAPVGAYPLGRSPLGCAGMIGDVWEWTASDFQPYPGFTAFPYREYSEVFFGAEYKVLRGGSWATRPGAIRTTFRNWDYPIRRQIFAGFRCARDD